MKEAISNDQGLCQDCFFWEGIIKVTNLDSKEEIVKERDFWFAWYAFHPDTKLYGVEGN